VPSLPISLHRSPFAGAKFIDHPLQIPPYRQMAKKWFQWQEFKFTDGNMNTSVMFDNSFLNFF
jgi:hypothetical protein